MFFSGQIYVPGRLDVGPARLLSLYDSEDIIFNNEFAHAVASGSQRFLEHNLLAIGSLYSHVRSPVPTPELYVAALSHHMEASRLFRRSVKQVTEQNWVATLGFAISIVVFQLNICRGNDMQSIMETMFVLRNAAAIAQILAPWYNRSRIRVLVEGQMHECDSPTWMAEVIDALNDLEKFNAADVSSDFKQEHRRNATNALRQWVLSMNGYPRAWTHFLWWPANVSKAYLKLLAACDSDALVVFLHWCAIMTRAPKRWFLDDWASTVAMAAVRGLGPEWDANIEWPLRVLGIGPAKTLPGSRSNATLDNDMTECS